MRVKVLFTGFVTLFLLLIASTAVGKPPGGHLNINQVLVDDPNEPTSITIVGEDLLFGSYGPVVTLGEYLDPLVIVGVPTDEVIVALLPENLDAGDYLLTVSNGNGQSQNDEYDLTIGAVGPQGPQGDKGDTGDTGPVGPAGADGKDGAPGQDGLDGQDGANCYDGIGTSVADCIGPPGPAGEDGADGAPGTDGARGADGAPGAPGEPGLSNLIATDSLVGIACDAFGNGGTRVRSGLDTDRDGILSDAEVQATEYVCDGEDGADGADGADGQPGPAGPSASTYALRTFDNVSGFFSRRVYCDAGDVLQSGGYSTGSSATVVTNNPTFDNFLTGSLRQGWLVSGVTSSEQGLFVDIWCLDVQTDAPFRSKLEDNSTGSASCRSIVGRTGLWCNI